MSHELLLPATLRLHELEAIDATRWGWDADAPASFVDTTGPLSFIEPVGLAMISAWSAHQRLRRHRSCALSPDHRSPYAYRAGLAPLIRGEVPQRLPGQVARCFRDSTAHHDGLAALVEQMGLDHEPTVEVLRFCIDDLCQNVWDHALGHTGAHVAASYDPATRRVRLGIADCGQGIAADMKSAYADGEALTDLQAVEAALEPEISGSRSPGNRGVGLVVTRLLALAGEGAMWLMTGGVVARSRAGTPTERSPEVQLTDGFWQGTAVALSFRASRIGDYDTQLRSILDELEGKGPAFAKVKFINRAGDGPGEVIAIQADAACFALDRAQAMRIQRDRLEPALAAGQAVVLDFRAAKHTSQGFCHALVADLVARRGPGTLEHLVFAACAEQVKVSLRAAIQHGLRHHGSSAV